MNFEVRSLNFAESVARPKNTKPSAWSRESPGSRKVWQVLESKSSLSATVFVSLPSDGRLLGLGEVLDDKARVSEPTFDFFF